MNDPPAREHALRSRETGTTRVRAELAANGDLRQRRLRVVPPRARLDRGGRICCRPTRASCFCGARGARLPVEVRSAPSWPCSAAQGRGQDRRARLGERADKVLVGGKMAEEVERDGATSFRGRRRRGRIRAGRGGAGRRVERGAGRLAQPRHRPVDSRALRGEDRRGAHRLLERPDGCVRVAALRRGTTAVAEAVAAAERDTVVGGATRPGRRGARRRGQDRLDLDRRGARWSCSKARSSRAWRPSQA